MKDLQPGKCARIFPENIWNGSVKIIIPLKSFVSYMPLSSLCDEDRNYTRLNSLGISGSPAHLTPNRVQTDAFTFS